MNPNCQRLNAGLRQSLIGIGSVVRFLVSFSLSAIKWCWPYSKIGSPCDLRMASSRSLGHCIPTPSIPWNRHAICSQWISSSFLLDVSSARQDSKWLSQVTRDLSTVCLFIMPGWPGLLLWIELLIFSLLVYLFYIYKWISIKIYNTWLFILFFISTVILNLSSSITVPEGILPPAVLSVTHCVGGFSLSMLHICCMTEGELLNLWATGFWCNLLPWWDGCECLPERSVCQRKPSDMQFLISTLMETVWRVAKSAGALRILLFAWYENLEVEILAKAWAVAKQGAKSPGAT